MALPLMSWSFRNCLGPDIGEELECSYSRSHVQRMDAVCLASKQSLYQAVCKQALSTYKICTFLCAYHIFVTTGKALSLRKPCLPNLCTKSA